MSTGGKSKQITKKTVDFGDLPFTPFFGLKMGAGKEESGGVLTLLLLYKVLMRYSLLCVFAQKTGDFLQKNRNFVPVICDINATQLR